jgi:WD40 repeat protein
VEVTGIQSFGRTEKSDELILAAQWLDQFHVFDLKDLNPIKTAKGVTDILKDDIRCVQLNEYHSVVGSGSAFGVVQLWDFEMLKPISVLHNHSACIKAICFTDEYPIMATCSLDGMICVFSIRRGYDRNASIFLAKFVNTEKIDSLKTLAIPVTCAQAMVLNSNVIFQTELVGKVRKQAPEQIDFF